MANTKRVNAGVGGNRSARVATSAITADTTERVVEATDHLHLNDDEPLLLNSGELLLLEGWSDRVTIRVPLTDPSSADTLDVWGGSWGLTWGRAWGGGAVFTPGEPEPFITSRVTAAASGGQTKRVPMSVP